MNDYRGNAPYGHFKEHKMKYAKGYRGKEQKNIGEKPGKGNSKAMYSHDDNRGNNSRDQGKGKGGDGHGKKK